VATAAIRRRLTWQSAQVLAVEPETPRATRLVLDVADWPGHVPGQHLDVRLTAEDGYTAQRSYSIASAPQNPHVELVVEALPDGEVSPYLTGVLRAGDELELRGPVGGYFVWHDGLGGPLQLIAGGSGVVPFLAMVEHHRAVGSQVLLQLLYSARTLDDVIGRGRLTGYQLTLALTRDAPPGWTGLTGRIDQETLRAGVLPPNEHPQVFVCGPTTFVEAVTSTLVDLGHLPHLIKTERFGASGGPP
jgi:ferredoxin-NADP reductase